MSDSKATAADFAARLKGLRMAKGLTQREFSKSVGVHHVHYNRYEKGAALPSTETISKLAEGLGVSVDYLLEGKKEDAAVARLADRDLLKMFEEVEKFSTAEKEHVKFFLDSAIAKKKLQQLAS